MPFHFVPPKERIQMFERREALANFAITQNESRRGGERIADLNN
jgi:hypothetical protein